MNEELAIIEGGSFGMRDTNAPVLWFGVKMLSGGSLLVFSGQKALDFVKDNDIEDVRQLNGRACVVETDGSTVKFARMFK